MGHGEDVLQHVAVHELRLPTVRLVGEWILREGREHVDVEAPWIRMAAPGGLRARMVAK